MEFGQIICPTGTANKNVDDKEGKKTLFCLTSQQKIAPLPIFAMNMNLCQTVQHSRIDMRTWDNPKRTAHKACSDRTSLSFWD